MMADKKICTKCKQVKSLNAYSVRRASSDGLAFICRECTSAAGRQWYLKNSQSCKERAMAWAQSNREKRREIVARSQHARREQRAKSEQTRLNSRTPERILHDRVKARRATALRKARIKGNGGYIDAEWWIAHIDLFDTGACLYCGTYGNTLVMDHFVPIVRGGRTEVGNMLPCCGHCNSSKCGADPAIWVVKQCGEKAYEGIIEFLRLIAEAHQEALA